MPTITHPTTHRRVATADGQKTIWFLETAADTDGARTYVEAELGPGNSTPMHFHTAFAEHFEVLDGALTIECDGARHVLGPGDSVSAPIGSHHRFANESDGPVRFRCALEPASRGFEESQQIAMGLMADGLARGDLPRSPRHLGLLIELSDSGFCGLMGILRPIFGLAAASGRRRGELEQLRERYVRW